VISCRALGPVEVTLDGAVAPPGLLWKKHLALLVYLARSGQRGRTREHLTGLLWPESDESRARHSLNVALGHIRRHAGEQAIDGTHGALRLAPGAVTIDVDALQARCALEDWAGAAALISGEFLEGFALEDASMFEDWLAAERAHWRNRSVDALVHYAEALLRTGETADATHVAGRALQLDPRSERSVRTLMRSLALLGDRAAALEQHRRFVARLGELNAVSERATDELAERIAKQRLVRPLAAEGAPGGPPIDRLPLAGRSSELGSLLDAAAGAIASRRAAVLVVEGETGAGKTRLADEVLSRLRLDGVTAAAARAIEGDRVAPGSGILVLARAGLVDAPGISAAAPEAIGALAAALPEWAERFPSAGASGWPVGRAFLDVVRAGVVEQPVVLAMDDAQWLDDASAAVLSALLRDQAATPLLLLLTLAAHTPRPDLDEVRSRIGRELAGVVVPVRPLTAAGLSELAERMLPGYDAAHRDRVVRRVWADSAGIALLAVELLRAVALGLDLGTVPAAWPDPHRTLDQSLPGDLPDAVVAAIRIGVRRRTPDAQRVLAAAAVLGDRVPATRIARALGAAPDVVQAALDELEWHHWLVAEPRGYGFVARIVRQVVERDMLTPGQRRRLREAAGEEP
jgi:DNA-binding SARP family transcriptional activator